MIQGPSRILKSANLWIWWTQRLWWISWGSFSVHWATYIHDIATLTAIRWHLINFCRSAGTMMCFPTFAANHQYTAYSMPFQWWMRPCSQTSQSLAHASNSINLTFQLWAQGDNKWLKANSVRRLMRTCLWKHWHYVHSMTNPIKSLGRPSLPMTPSCTMNQVHRLSGLVSSVQYLWSKRWMTLMEFSVNKNLAKNQAVIYFATCKTRKTFLQGSETRKSTSFTLRRNLNKKSDSLPQNRRSISSKQCRWTRCWRTTRRHRSCEIKT